MKTFLATGIHTTIVLWILILSPRLPLFLLLHWEKLVQQPITNQKSFFDQDIELGTYGWANQFASSPWGGKEGRRELEAREIRNVRRWTEGAANCEVLNPQDAWFSLLLHFFICYFNWSWLLKPIYQFNWSN